MLHTASLVAANSFLEFHPSGYRWQSPDVPLTGQLEILSETESQIARIVNFGSDRVILA